MNLLAIRFMLFHSRMELALAIIGNNRQRISQARADVARWDAERDRALLLEELKE